MSVSRTKEVLEECRKIDQEFHPFMTISDDLALSQAQELEQRDKGSSGRKDPEDSNKEEKERRKGKRKLSGLYISVKDCICVRDVETRAGSRILEGYKPVFDATVIERLKAQDAIVIGKTTQDAWGFGSFNMNVGKGYDMPLNPLDKSRVTGGSSGGAAALTKLASFRHVAVAESTGGSIECPASFCGVIGFCPTYGRLSRWGLICYADSLDKIGFMSRKVDDLYPVLEVAAGHDPRDGTSLRPELDLSCSRKRFRVGLIRETMKTIDPKVKGAISDTARKLRDAGHDVVEVSLPITMKFGISAYYILATSEASTNLSRYCGLRYGKEENPKGKGFNEYFTEIRSRHFNEESKRRVILGTFARMAGYRDAYYVKATKVRTRIIEEYKNLFRELDILISPTMPILPPRFEEARKLRPIETYMMDALSVGPNMAGIPHASIPVADVGGLSVGMMASADHLEEGKLLSFLKVVEGLQ